MRSALIFVLALLLAACGDIGDEEGAAPDAPDDTEEDEVAEDPIDEAPDDPADGPGEPPEQVYPEDHDEQDRERRAPEGDEPGKVTGTLGGSAELEGGCVWIDTAGGRYELSWPDRYNVETDPVRVLRDGEVVAEAGDRITVRGSVQADAITICQVGPLFRVAQVETP